MFRVPEITHLRFVAEAAARIDGGIGALISRIEPGGLRLAAHCGVEQPFVAAALFTPADSQTSCAQAARERRRVVIRDVYSDEAYAPYLELARLGGFVGVQSAPLLDRDRRMLGVLSTLYAGSHHPSTASLELIDACARVGARLIEAATAHEELSARDRRIGVPPRALSREGAQAADAARILLPALPRDGGAALLESTERHLTVVIQELEIQLARTGDQRRVDVGT